MFLSDRDYILIANFVGMALLPFLLLAALNFKLYATIRVFLISSTTVIITDVPFKESGAKNQKTTHRQKRDRQIASLLIILVIVNDDHDDSVEKCKFLHGGVTKIAPLR